MNREVKRFYVNPAGPQYLVEMTDAYRVETGAKGLVKGEDYDTLLAELAALRRWEQMVRENSPLLQRLEAAEAAREALLDGMTRIMQETRLGHSAFAIAREVVGELEANVQAQGGAR